MKKLFLILLIGLALPAWSWADDDDYNSNRIVPGPKQALDIKIWADKPNEATYREGENITLYFRANRDCYFALYDVDTRGRLFLLYPQNPDEPNFIEGGVTYQIPSPDDEFNYWVTGPSGSEFVQAVACLRPFDLPANWPAYYRGERAPRGYQSSPIQVDNENIEDFLYETNSRIIPMKRYPDECAEDLYTFYVEPRYRAYRPVYYDYGYCDFDYPYGSEIWIDGIFCGTAPFYHYTLIPGCHIVRVIQPGCPPYIRQVYCYPNRSFSLSFSVNFDFGYRNHRYYRDYYPYSYFCYISPDYRYKYRPNDNIRFKTIYQKDVRYKSWGVRDLPSQAYKSPKPVYQNRERSKGETGRIEFKGKESSQKYRPDNEGWKDSRKDDGQFDSKRNDEFKESKKSKPIYQVWKNPKKDEGREPSEKKGPVEYQGRSEDKKERGSKTWDEGRQPSPNYDAGKKERVSKSRDTGEQPSPRYDAGKKQEHHSAPAVKESPPRSKSKQDDGGGKQTRSKKGKDD